MKKKILKKKIIKKNDKSIFFIESHPSLYLDMKIYRSTKNNIGASDLNKIKSEEKDSFLVSLYSIKFSQLKEKKIEINTIYQNNELEGYINLKVDTKNCFYFDFKFDPKKITNGEIMPPDQLQMNYLDKFNFFLNYLKELNCSQNDILMKDLVLDSLSLIREQPKTHIDFFLCVFRECYTTDLIGPLFFTIRAEKLTKPYYEMANIAKYRFLKAVERNPQNFLRKAKAKNKEKLFFTKFYTVLLYYKLNAKEPKIIQSMIKNEDIEEYIIEILIQNYEIFQGIDLENKTLELMMLKCTKHKELKNIFSYITDLNTFLSLLDNNIKKIINIMEGAIKSLEKEDKEQNKEKKI